jgi:hypothetical protein
MLNILTRPPQIFFKGALKYYAARVATLLGRVRGPASVVASMKRGLAAISYPFVMNEQLQPDQIVHVLSNTEALRYAIEAKRSGKIKRLIAGPNLVVLPTDHDKIAESPEIDAFLVPSVWVRDMYVRLSPMLREKMYLWPAGVAMPEQYKKISPSPQNCLPFRKTAPDDIYRHVLETLSQNHIKVTELHYGNFSQKKYFSALETVDFMIYLQEIESQGLALQEAWARNIPSLVWNKGTFTFKAGVRVEGNLSAPLLTPEAGMLFSGTDDFKEKLGQFLNHFGHFRPRDYCELELSDKASAAKYVKILRKIIDHNE